MQTRQRHAARHDPSVAVEHGAVIGAELVVGMTVVTQVGTERQPQPRQRRDPGAEATGHAVVAAGSDRLALGEAITDTTTDHRATGGDGSDGDAEEAR